MHKREIRQLICAMLLGDGCLSKIKRKNSSFNSARFIFKHSINQTDFSIWKAELINNIFRNKNLPKRCQIKKGKQKDTRTNKIYKFVTVTLNWTEYFRHLRKHTYKIISGEEIKDVEYLLTQLKSDIHLAIWFGDDGTEYRPRKKRNKEEFHTPKLMLCTDSFTEGQNKLIRQWFINNRNIYPTIYKHVGHYRLFFPIEESKKLFILIAPYLKDIPSMRQKFWLSYKKYFVDKSEPLYLKREDIVRLV